MKITISIVDDSASKQGNVFMSIICTINECRFLPCLDSFQKIPQWDACHESEVQSLFVELVLCEFRETFGGQL